MQHEQAFPMDVATVNELEVPRFVVLFGDVAEHAPWVAEMATGARPYANREAMIDAFGDAVTAAPIARQTELLRAHPDLAGKAALAGEVTDDSAREQAGAGLDTLTADEFARFTALNTRYRETFGIPFIFAVKGATKHDILGAFEERLSGTKDGEFAIALQQVCRIIRFRLEDRVSA